MITLFNYFIEKWRLSFSILMLILMMGFSGMSSLKQEAFPSVNIGTVIVTTIYPGSSSQETEENVTEPIEEQLRSVTGMKDITSFSQAGMSRIVIRVDIDHEDMDEVLDDIKEAVDRAGPLPDALPEPPHVLELKSDEMAIMHIALWTDENVSDSLRYRVADNLDETLEFLDGVSRVDLEGYSPREFQILLDQDKMKKLNVGVSEVQHAIATSVLDVPAGEIEWKGLKKLVRVTGKVKKPEELENILVRANFSGYNIRIKDIARVIDGNEEADQSVRFNGKPAVTLQVIKKTNADIVKTGDRVNDALEEYRPKLPEGMHIDVFDSEEERVKTKLGIVLGNAVAGIFLVLGALLIFFPGMPGIMTAISMPVSVLMVLGLMPSIGARINNITMTAIVISLGLLVDNAIVVGENFVRLRHEGVPPLDAAKRAVSQFWIPILATALTTIMSFVPMLVTTGVMGQFISYIPMIVTIAIAASLLEAFILLPARLRFTMREKKGENHDMTEHYQEKGWFAYVQKQFHRFVMFSIRYRYFTALSFPIMIIFSFLLTIYGNYFELFPQVDVEIYLAKFEAAQGTNLKQTEQYALKLEKKILDALGRDKVKYTVISVGTTQDVPFDVMPKFGENTGRIRVVFPLEVARTQEYKVILEKLRAIKMDGEFENLWFESKAAGPPVGKALELTVSGDNFERVIEGVEEIKKEIKKYPGILEVNDDNVQGMPEIHFDVNRELLLSGGFSIMAMGHALRTAMQGDKAALVNTNGDQIGIRVRYDAPFRTSSKNIMDTTLTGMTGNQVPVSGFSRVRETTGAAVRKHYQYRRAVTVSADVDNKNMTSVKINGIVRNEVVPRLEKQYPGVHFNFLGEEESRKEAFQSLMSAMVIAIAFIFIILVFIFNSFIKPFIILGTIPLALIGVNVAFFIHQKPLSFLAVIGIIGLIGVVINATIILISYVDELIEEGEHESHELLGKAAVSRLKPILVTSLTTIGGFLPTAYGLGGYDPMLAPLTLAMAWGMITATFLGLVATPVSLAILDDFSLLMHRVRERLFGA